MSKIYHSLPDLLSIPRHWSLRIKNGLKAKLIAKLEYFNPASSVKDGIAKAMLDVAEEKGMIHAGSVIIKPTSGNTGIGLASVAAARGYRAIVTIPETISIEQRSFLKAYDAEIVLTECALGMKGAIAKAEELAIEIPNSFIPSQFSNMANPAVHKAIIESEIWENTDASLIFSLPTLVQAAQSAVLVNI